MADFNSPFKSNVCLRPINSVDLHNPTHRIVNQSKSFLLVVLLSLQISQIIGQCTTVINSFPHKEGFEIGTSNWISGGLNNDWAWGRPAKPVITGAGAGINCWITGGLTGSFYNYGERSWVESPCFDFTTLNRPFVSFLIFWDTERTYDGGNFQYSLDLGVTWKNAGRRNDPVQCNDQNWFNHSGITNLNSFIQNTDGWSGTTQSSSGSCSGGGGSGTWKLASHCLKVLANQPQVKFRFTFGSGTTCNNYDGLAFDDFYISEAPSISNNFIYSCVNGTTLSFNDLDPGCHTQWTWNFGDSLSANNTFSGNNAIHQFSSGGTYNVTLNTGGACAIDTQIIKQIKILSATSQSTTASCIGSNDGTAQIVVRNPGAGISYSWSHDPLLNSTLATGLLANDYNVTITEPASCNLSLVVTVGYGPGAHPSVSLGDETFICSGSQFVLYPGSYSSYEWQDNSTDSFFTVEYEGVYFVKIKNSFGCSASDTLLVKEDCINDILVPNAFTPNGDAVNDVFTISGSITTKFNIYIYNRWGEMIYFSENREIGWDGSVKGRAVQEGFYNYIINYSIHDDKRSRKGSIYVFR